MKKNAPMYTCDFKGIMYHKYFTSERKTIRRTREEAAIRRSNSFAMLIQQLIKTVICI